MLTDRWHTLVMHSSRYRHFSPPINATALSTGETCSSRLSGIVATGPKRGSCLPRASLAWCIASPIYTLASHDLLISSSCTCSLSSLPHTVTMAFATLVASSNTLLSVAFLSIAILTTAVLYAFRGPPLPKNAPRLVTEAWPIIGSMQFFTQRTEFFQRQVAHSPTGNFSFYAGGCSL